MERERQPERVMRFTGAERAAHWLVAAAFLVIFLSGTQMPRRWTLASIPFDLHVGSAAVLVVGVVALAAVRAQVFRRTGRELWQMDGRDAAWLRSVPHRLLSGAPAPPPARFNAGQKMNARLSLLGLGLLYASGITLLLAGRGVLQGTMHAAVTAGMIVLIGGHIFMAALNPGTRHAMRGMILGDVDRQWAEHHHPRWHASTARRRS